MPFFADFYIFAVKKLFLCIGIEKFEKYLTEICGFLPVIAALLSPRPPLNNKPLIHNGLAFFMLFSRKFPNFGEKLGKKYGCSLT